MTAFLQKARPLWLENDIFVFHTSPNKRYLKRLKKRYEDKYHLHLSLYKNRYFWKKTFQLRTIDYEDFLEYTDDSISKYRDSKKRKKQQKQKRKPKNTTIPIVKIEHKREARLVQKATQYLQKHTKDKETTLHRYILYKEVAYPSIFSSNTPIYNLYLIGILQRGKTKWLADTRFIFHTSHSKKYLKTLQKRYQKKYNLHLTLSKNRSYKKQKFELMSIDHGDIIAYLQAQIPTKYKAKQKSTKKSLYLQVSKKIEMCTMHN